MRQTGPSMRACGTCPAGIAAGSVFIAASLPGSTIFMPRLADTYPIIIVAMIVNGYAQGTKTQITGYLTAGYAGLRNFGTTYSFMSPLMALAAGLDPLIAGMIYDYSGGYGLFLIMGTIGCAGGWYHRPHAALFPAQEETVAS